MPSIFHSTAAGRQPVERGGHAWAPTRPAWAAAAGPPPGGTLAARPCRRTGVSAAGLRGDRVRLRAGQRRTAPPGPPRAASRPAGEPGGPPRRLTPAARATASVITPSSAPWCSSPASSRTRNCALGRGGPAEQVRPAAACRSACAPGPVTAPIAANTSSSTARVSARPGPPLAPALSGPGAAQAGPEQVAEGRVARRRSAAAAVRRTGRPPPPATSPGSARRSRLAIAVDLGPAARFPGHRL